MRVAQIAVRIEPGPGWGGATKVAVDLAKALALKGIDISILGINTKIEPECDTQNNLAAYTVPEDKSFIRKLWPFYAPTLANALAPNYDIIHIHEIWHYPCYIAHKKARRANTPYIVTVHGELELWCLSHNSFKKRAYLALIQKRILNEAAAIHAITEEEAKAIRAIGIKAPVVVIPNGIEPADFRVLPSPEEMDESYPELANKKVILFLGRIHQKKGLDILVRAVGQINRQDVHLLIVGPDYGYRAEIEKLLESKGLKATFTGMTTEGEKLAALSRADICVIPSYSEVRSLVALEAMACKKPIIITHQCQFPEIAEANAGIMIEPDPDQLANALKKLLDDPKLRKKMGENGHRLVLEKLTWDKVADQMIQLYEDILSNESL